MYFNQLFYRVTAIPANSPEYEAAISICLIRGLSPEDQVTIRMGTIERWRAIILETLLAQEIINRMSVAG